MIKVQGTNITMVRGDSEQLNVSIKDLNGEVVSLVAGDIIYFTVKRSVATTSLIAKVVETFSDGIAEIVIAPADTNDLDVNVAYVYDVRVKFANDVIKTIIPQSKFTLIGEVSL